MSQFKRLPNNVTMDELTKKQGRFVLAYVELAGTKGAGTEAALAAGYGRGIRQNAQNAARDLLRNPRVLSAIKEELKNKYTAGAAIGLKTLIELCQNGPASVRLKAAQDLIDRGVGPVVRQSAHLHAEVRSIEDVLEELEAEEEAKQPRERPQIASQRDQDVLDAEWSDVSESSRQSRQEARKER